MSLFSVLRCLPFARARSVALVCAAVVALVLSGCQGGGAPVGTGSETASSTASPTSSSAPAPTSAAVYKPADAKGKAENVPVPVMPEPAKENTKEGLEAFIRYWYAQQNYAIETGNQETWAQLSSPECLLCARLQKAVSDSHINGRWLAGGLISVPVVEPIWTEGARTQQAKVQVIQEQADYFNADGTVGRPSEAMSNSAFGFFAKFDDSMWKVADVGALT